MTEDDKVIIVAEATDELVQSLLRPLHDANHNRAAEPKEAPYVHPVADSYPDGRQLLQDVTVEILADNRLSVSIIYDVGDNDIILPDVFKESQHWAAMLGKAISLCRKPRRRAEDSLEAGPGSVTLKSAGMIGGR